jgi:outer membrane receptor protein involved in Fe transport
VNVAQAGADVAPPSGPKVDLPGSPDWLASGGLTWLAGDFTAAASGRYVGPHLLAPERDGGEAEGFFEANLRLLYRTRLVYPVVFHFDVKNLFGETGGPATSSSFSIPYAPLPGRQVLVGAEVRF